MSISANIHSEYSLTIYDILVFVSFLCISLCVGIYHAVKAHGEETRCRRRGETADSLELYHMGGRQMPIFPIILSIVATFLSGILLLGVSADMYQKGIYFVFFFLGGAFSFAFTAVVVLPVLYRLHLTSIYEYLELRFHSVLLRRMSAVIFVLFTTFYLSVVIYAPAIALEEVTGYSSDLFILACGVTATVYTAMGGLKAVVWTDALQATFMYGGLLMLVGKTIMHVDGLSNVFTIALETGRLHAIYRTDYNSIWISFVGGFFFWVVMHGVNQMAQQRYSSLPSQRHAQIVAYITIPCYLVMTLLSCLLGLVALAYFNGCDPVMAGRVRTMDQIVIYLAVKVLGEWPGMVGLFIATLFSGTLSTISSGMNSSAAVVWEDLVKHHCEPMKPVNATRLNKVIVLAIGVVATSVAFSCESLGGLIKAGIAITSSTGGPLGGVFLLGILFPRAGRKSALISLVLAELLMCYLAYGSFHYAPYADYNLPVNVHGCAGNVTVNQRFHSVSVAEATGQSNTTTPSLHFGDPSVPWVNRISVYAYCTIGCLAQLVCGVLLSFVFSDTQHRHTTYALTFWGRHVEWTAGEGGGEGGRPKGKAKVFSGHKGDLYDLIDSN